MVETCVGEATTDPRVRKLSLSVDLVLQDHSSGPPALFLWSFLSVFLFVRV